MSLLILNIVQNEYLAHVMLFLLFYTVTMSCVCRIFSLFISTVYMSWSVTNCIDAVFKYLSNELVESFTCRSWITGAWSPNTWIFARSSNRISKVHSGSTLFFNVKYIYKRGVSKLFICEHHYSCRALPCSSNSLVLKFLLFSHVLHIFTDYSSNVTSLYCFDYCCFMQI